MKFRLITSALSLFIATAGIQSASAKDLKVGYVNIQRIVNEVNEAKNAREQLKKDFQDKQKKLDGLQKDFERKMGDFEKQKHLMKPEMRAQKEAQLKQQYQQLHQTLMQLQNELGEREGSLAKEIHVKIRNLVSAMGDRDGYSIILDNSEMKGTVLYFKRHLDITDQIIQMYNKKYPSK